MQNNGHYAVRGHSMSPVSIPVESPYASSCVSVIVTYLLYRVSVPRYDGLSLLVGFSPSTASSKCLSRALGRTSCWPQRWLWALITVSVTAVLLLNSLPEQLRQPDITFSLDNSNNRWKRLCLASRAAARRPVSEL